MRRHHTLALFVILVLCALAPSVLRPGAPKLPSPAPARATATPTDEAAVSTPTLTPGPGASTRPPAMPNVEVPIPAGTLSIHKVSVRIPRSKIESWYGPGTALKTGITGYGQLYSDGFRTHYPLEVEYSARDLAVRISGNELYRGNQRVRVQQAKGGEIVLPGLCKGQLATAMLQGPANPEEYHFSGILDGPMIEPPDARISIYLLDDYTWFTIW